MTHLVEQLFLSVNRLINNGHAEDAAAHFSFPFAIYTDEDIILQASSLDVRLTLKRLEQALKFHGATHIDHRVVSIKQSPSGRMSVARLSWRYLDDNQVPVATSEVNYYCGAKNGGDLKIQMVEYLKPAFPGVVSKFLGEIAPRILH